MSISLSAGIVAAVAMAATALANPPARIKQIATGLISPTYIVSHAADPQNLYICERRGAVRVLDKDTGIIRPAPFLDLTGQVSITQENGLLGLAFAPDFATSGYVYVNFSNTTGEIVLARYQVPAGASAVDAASAYTILRYPRPLGHNGGWIGFSPVNGLLYITSGDGDLGGTYDQAGRAQSTTDQLMGKILRIDPHSDDFPADPLRNYHIPASNPFVGAVGDDEIWALGVRNAWRGSFDRATGDFIFGDVGMDSWEEVNFEPAASLGGRNYGWACTEGDWCTPSSACVCGDPSLTAPMHAYAHVFGVGGFSVTGGYVYRGTAIPAFDGLYFFADFLQPKVWSLRPQGGVGGGFSEFVDRSVEFTPPTATAPLKFIVTFGEDAAGELYVATLTTGRMYKIVPYPCLPEIDLQPVGRSEPVGTTIALSVLGAGGDPLAVRWLKDGVALSDMGGITGSATTTLSIASAVVGDSGSYVAEFTSPCGTTASAPAVVEVFGCRSADINGNGVLSPQDIFDFLFAYFSGAAEGDFDESGEISVQDIFDFLFWYFSGCA